MNYIIVVFRSRSETLNFSGVLKAMRISAAVINTPKDVSRACGISVKFFPEYKNKVVELLRQRRYSSFVGMYKISEQGVYRRIEKLD